MYPVLLELYMARPKARPIIKTSVCFEITQDGRIHCQGCRLTNSVMIGWLRWRTWKYTFSSSVDSRRTFRMADVRQRSLVDMFSREFRLLNKHPHTSKPGSAIGTLSIPCSSMSPVTSSIDAAFNSIDKFKISGSSTDDGGGGKERGISTNPEGSSPPALWIALSRTFCHVLYRWTAISCSLNHSWEL